MGSTLQLIGFHTNNRNRDTKMAVFHSVVFFLPLLLSVAGQDLSEDDKCFEKTREAAPNNTDDGTFEVLIRQDWSTGELLYLKKNEKTYHNVSLLSNTRDLLCVLLKNESSLVCDDEWFLSNVPSRVLVLKWDGSEICAAMARETIVVYEDDKEPEIRPINCTRVCQNATVAMDTMRFDYFEWDMSNIANEGIIDIPNLIDSVFVSGTSTTLASLLLLVLGVLWS